MEPVRLIEGRAVPLDRHDVDTDQIIPSDWLKRVERTGFGRGLFSQWRDDQDFILNHPNYVGATILLAGERFGTGSSREHAVWALMDHGFCAVVASSFGDIFKNNATKSGLVTVQLTASQLAELMELVRREPACSIVIDVQDATIEVAQHSWLVHFDMLAATRERLLNGWDDVGLTMRNESQITEYEQAHNQIVSSVTTFQDSQRRVLHSDG